MPGVSSFLSTSEEHLKSGLSSFKLSISLSKAVFVTFVVRHDSSDSLAKLLSGEISIGIVTVNGSQRQPVKELKGLLTTNSIWQSSSVWVVRSERGH